MGPRWSFLIKSVENLVKRSTLLGPRSRSETEKLANMHVHKYKNGLFLRETRAWLPNQNLSCKKNPPHTVRFQNTVNSFYCTFFGSQNANLNNSIFQVSEGSERWLHRISTARKEKGGGRHFFRQIEPN